MTKTTADAPVETATPSPQIPTTFEPEGRTVGSALHERLVRRKLFESSITAVVFVLLFAGFGIWLGNAFFNVPARLLDVHQNTPILLLALAALSTLIPGMFDLSIAGVATLSAFMVIGLRAHQGLPFPAVLAITLGLGIVVGLINGFLVERLRVSAFIATLGTGGICTGISAVYSGGTLLTPTVTQPQLPNWFVALGDFGYKVPSWLVYLAIPVIGATLFVKVDHMRPQAWSRQRWITVKGVFFVLLACLLIFAFKLSQWISEMSWMIFVLLVAALCLYILLEYTTFGRHLRAIGSNRSAASLAGVAVRRQVVKSFTMGAVFAALAGIALAASQGTASPDAAGSFLLPAFAAAFLSTVVLSHGRFTVPGTVIGGIFVVWVGLALIIAGLDPTWIPVVNGVILVGAVALSTAMRRAS